ncbi:MAG: MotA/TolQ/ExbB proton channel family protein [Planctomycetes bacterium]|nr:MotA/TolQ/ExbB proton channel family protein [Planctomycetota bacterium]
MVIDSSEKKNTAHPASFIIGIVILIVFTILVIGLYRLRQEYLDIPSFLIVFAFILGALLITSGVGNLLKSIYASISGKITSIEDAEAAIVSCGIALWAALIGGVVGTLIGVINMLGSYSADIYALMSGSAVALITILYALLFACFFMAVRARIVQSLYRHEEMEIAEDFAG